MSHFSLAAPASVIIAAVLLWLGGGWLCVANWRRSANRRASGRLETLRFILITLLALSVASPGMGEDPGAVVHAGDCRSCGCVGKHEHPRH